MATGSHTVTANYVNSDGNFVNNSGSLAGGQQVNALTSANLQTLLASTSTPTIMVTTDADLQTAISAVDGLTAPAAPATITVDVNGPSFTDITAQPPDEVTLTLAGNGTSTTFVGQSPALTVTSGNVIVTGVIFTTTTDAPTILVTGGNLALRNDTVQESTGGTDAAIALTGGTLDLGTATDPGGNTLNINGTGEFVHNTTANAVPPVGDTFEANGTPLTAPYLSFTALAASANPSVFGQAVTFTATVLANAPAPGTPGGAAWTSWT